MYEDKTLVCKDCGNEFVFTAGEQEFYAEKGFTNEPQRCKECRDKRKHAPREYHGPHCIPLIPVHEVLLIIHIIILCSHQLHIYSPRCISPNASDREYVRFFLGLYTSMTGAMILKKFSSFFESLNTSAVFLASHRASCSAP